MSWRRVCVVITTATEHRTVQGVHIASVRNRPGFIIRLQSVFSFRIPSPAPPVVIPPTHNKSSSSRQTSFREKRFSNEYRYRPTQEDYYHSIGPCVFSVNSTVIFKRNRLSGNIQNKMQNCQLKNTKILNNVY